MEPPEAGDNRDVTIPTENPHTLFNPTMKTMTGKVKYTDFKYIFMALMAILLSGCRENDDFSSGSAAEMLFTISGRSMSATRGSGIPEDDASPSELINSWWVAFANASDKKIVAFASDSRGGVWQDSFSLELTPGLYDIVAFANVVPTHASSDSYTFTASSGSSLTFTKGEVLPSGLESLTWDAPDDPLLDTDGEALWPSGHLIPMTGLQRNVRLSAQAGYPTFIEVVRQVAKIEVLLGNTTGRSITVREMTIGAMQNGPVNLFPTYSLLGDHPDLPRGLQPFTVRKTFGTNGLTLDANSGDAGADSFSGKRVVMYLPESWAEHPTGHYPIAFTIDYRPGSNSLPGVSGAQVTALLSGLEYVNRNDHVVIPVNFSDYIVKINTIYYPPIGGYPAIVEQMDNGEYYITFASSGKFVMTPLVYPASGGEALTPDQLDIIDVSVLSGSEIFSKAPAYDANADQIIGVIADGNYDTPAEAKIKIRFKVKRTDSPALDLEYSRLVTIIRKSPVSTR